MNNETKELEATPEEKNIAEMWFDSGYTEAQAKLSWELQDLNWINIGVEYSRLYEKDAAATGLIDQQSFGDTLYGQV